MRRSEKEFTAAGKREVNAAGSDFRLERKKLCIVAP